MKRFFMLPIISLTTFLNLLTVTVGHSEDVRKEYDYVNVETYFKGAKAYKEDDCATAYPLLINFQSENRSYLKLEDSLQLSMMIDWCKDKIFS